MLRSDPSSGRVLVVLLVASLGFDRISFFGRLSLSEVVLIAAGLWMLTHLPAALGRLQPARGPLLLISGFFLVVSTVSIFSSGRAPAEDMLTGFGLLACVVAVVALIGGPREADQALLGYWVGAAVTALLGYAQLISFMLSGDPIFAMDRSWLALPGFGAVILRMAGPLENPAQFAFFLVFPTTTLWLTELVGTRNTLGLLSPWLRRVLIAFLTAAVVLSVTRGAVLALIVGVAGGLIVYHRTTLRSVLLVVPAVVASVLFGSRVASAVVSINPVSLEARGSALRQTLRSWLTYPVAGHGWGTQVEIGAGISHNPHSALLQALLNGGLVGAGLLVLAWGWILASLIPLTIRSGNNGGSPTPAIILGGLLGVFTQTLILDPTLTLKGLWVPVALGMVCGMGKGRPDTEQGAVGGGNSLRWVQSGQPVGPTKWLG